MGRLSAHIRFPSGFATILPILFIELLSFWFPAEFHFVLRLLATVVACFPNVMFFDTPAPACHFFFLQVILRLFISTDLSRFTPSLRCYVFRYFAHIDIMPVQNCLGFSINFNSLAFFTQVRFSKALLALIVLATFSI